ncbi:MAG: hypothetical protein CMJ37_00570 [Phycisphaerae bacterium]|nr:hypothetical protein [Phycisphaerae bacterium]
MNESWSMPPTEVLFLLAGLLLTMVVVAVVGTMLFRAYRAEIKAEAEAKATQSERETLDDQSEEA